MGREGMAGSVGVYWGGAGLVLFKRGPFIGGRTLMPPTAEGLVPSLVLL